MKQMKRVVCIILLYGSGLIGYHNDVFGITLTAENLFFYDKFLKLKLIDDIDMIDTALSELEYNEREKQGILWWPIDELDLNLTEEIREASFNRALIKFVYGERVKSIGVSCFLECKFLKKAKFSQLNQIPGFAFKDSTIEEIDVPLLEVIGFHAFSSTPISTLGEAAPKKIEAFAFMSCQNLRKVNLSKIEFIGYKAFSGCSKLSHIGRLPPNVVIEDNAFEGCVSLDKEVFSNIKRINPNAFGFSVIKNGRCVVENKNRCKSPVRRSSYTITASD